MKRRRLTRWVRAGVTATAAVLLAYHGWEWYRWDTVCTASSPDGTRRAIVRREWVPHFPDGRYSYYLTFDPPAASRPTPGGATERRGRDVAERDWAEEQYLGRLRGMDRVADREPSAIEWAGGRVVLRSREADAWEYDVRP